MATAHTVINNFIKKGFNMLGSGCYAAVFESNTDPNLVYKVGVRTSDPFLSYIKDQSLTNNPHFPRIHKLFVYDTWYMAEMERLEPVPSHKVYLSKEIRSLVSEKLDQVKELKLTAELRMLTDRIRNLAEQLDCKIDLHQGNIMMRGLTPVITDPLCDNDIYTEWDLENWLGKNKNYQRNASCSC